MKRNIVTLVSAKAVNGGKITLDFSQIVNQNESSASLTSLLNADDERFNQAKPRHAFIAGSPALIKDMFGIDCSGLALGETLEIGQEEPTINGELLNLQVTETVKGSDYDQANLDTRAKRAGKDGDFIMTSDGKHIFTRVDVVAGAPKHYKIPGTIRQSVAVDASAAIADALGE